MVDRHTAARLDEIEARLAALEGSTVVDAPDPDETADDGSSPRVIESADQLVRDYSRAELDELATFVGVESPASLPNKRVVAEHIIEASE